MLQGPDVEVSTSTALLVRERARLSLPRALQVEGLTQVSVQAPQVPMCCGRVGGRAQR